MSDGALGSLVKRVAFGPYACVNIYGYMLAKGDARIRTDDHCALPPRVRILSATHDHRSLPLPDGRSAWRSNGKSGLVRAPQSCQA